MQFIAYTTHVMTGGQRGCTKFAGRVKQIVELYLLIADDTWYWRFAARIAVSKAFNDALFEAFFIVQNIVRDAKSIGNGSRIIYVLTGTTCAFFSRSLAMIVQLQRNADDVIPLIFKDGGSDGGVGSP